MAKSTAVVLMIGTCFLFGLIGSKGGFLLSGLKFFRFFRACGRNLKVSWVAFREEWQNQWEESIRQGGVF